MRLGKNAASSSVGISVHLGTQNMKYDMCACETRLLPHVFLLAPTEGQKSPNAMTAKGLRAQDIPQVRTHRSGPYEHLLIPGLQPTTLNPNILSSTWLVWTMSSTRREGRDMINGTTVMKWEATNWTRCSGVQSSCWTSQRTLMRRSQVGHEHI